jgi:protein associated with RNAse G/E
MAPRLGNQVRVEAWALDGALKKYVDSATVLHAGPDVTIIHVDSGHVGRAPDGEVLWRSSQQLDYHFWPGKEYNLLRFYNAEGEWAGDYYNVGSPFETRQGAVGYADLELDVFLPPGEEARLLDEDELEAAPYSPALKAHVREVGAWLMAVAGTDQAPGGRAPDRRKSGI